MGIRSQNNPAASYLDKWVVTGYDAAGPSVAPTGHNASGGLVTEYTDPGPGDVYRAHTFEGSGSFVVNSLGDVDSLVDIFLIGGGGGGGCSTPSSSWGAGGGGAGGGCLKTSFTISAQTYPVVIGAGGYGAKDASWAPGSPPTAFGWGKPGGTTTFNSPTATLFTGNGGGGGGTRLPSGPYPTGIGNQIGQPGGCGGGSSGSNPAENTGYAGGSETQSGTNPTATDYGTAGASSVPLYPAGDTWSGNGGGGLGGAGSQSIASPSVLTGAPADYYGTGGAGGIGLANVYAGGPTNPITYGGGGGGGASELGAGSIGCP